MKKPTIPPDCLEFANKRIISVDLTLMQWVMVLAAARGMSLNLKQEGQHKSAAELVEVSEAVDLALLKDGEKYAAESSGPK